MGLKWKILEKLVHQTLKFSATVLPDGKMHHQILNFL